MKRVIPAALLLLLVCIPASTLEWYRSGPGGIPGNRISSGGTIGAGWTLSVERKDNTEFRTLYENERVFSTVLLIREAGRLISREERDTDGRLVARVEYAYDAAGKPRASYIATGDDDNPQVYIESRGAVQADGTVARHHSGGGGDWIISDLDDSGRTSKQLSFVDGSLETKETWTRSEDGRLIESVVDTGDESVQSLYDSQGRLVEEQTKRRGYVVLTRNYTWSETKLVRVEERGEGRYAVREIEWAGNSISREQRFVDGIIEAEISWTSPSEKVETLYRDGSPVIRVYWSDNRRLKEEFLRNGDVIRVQELSR